MDIDTTLLFQFLVWIVTGGGASVATYLLMDKLPALTELTGEHKRYASLILAALFAMIGFLVVVALGYHPQPGSTQAWIENLFAVAFLSVTSSQTIHGRAKLRA